MDVMDAKGTADLLPYPELADSIREVALAMASEDLEAPPRLVLPLQEGGLLLVMPAADTKIAITKLVTVHPENPTRDLPTIQGEVVVMDATTGERLGLLEGGVVTARRTAALSMQPPASLPRTRMGHCSSWARGRRGAPTSTHFARASASPRPSSLPGVGEVPYPSPGMPGVLAWKQRRSRDPEKCSTM